MTIRAFLHVALGAALAAQAGVSVAAPRDPAPASPASLGFDAQRLAKLDAYMKSFVDRQILPGIAYSVRRHGKVVDRQAYGYARVSTQTPFDGNSIVRIASMTKPITGVAMMILFEEGKWHLDDPISKYIPEFKNLRVYTSTGPKGEMLTEPAKHEPTMRELMSHTAGFGYGLPPGMGKADPVNTAYVEKGVLRSQGLQQMIDRLATIPLAYQPGTSWQYSASADIQGYIVQKLSGMTFGQFLQQRLFGPLGMNDTGFQITPDKVSRMAGLYAGGPNGTLVEQTRGPNGDTMDYTRPPNMEGGGGQLLSTLHDYSRFAQMVTNHGELDGVRILSPATIDLMGTSVLAPGVVVNVNGTTLANPNPYVGFGLDFSVIDQPRKAGTLEGPGVMAWGGAFGTFFWVDRANDMDAVIFLQRGGPLPGEDIRANVRTMVYAALADPAK